MPKTIFDINIKGKSIPCIAMGRGPEFCFIIGPGSFYSTSLITNSNIGELCTFFTCDPHWTGSDNQHFTSLEELLDFNNEVIKKIIKKFSLKKIGILGFSAPACLAISYTKKYPKNVSWLKLIGPSLEALDPEFTFSNKVFIEKASVEKIKKYEADQEIKLKIEQNNGCNNLYFSEHDFFWDSNGKRCLKPNSAWVLETVSLYHKAFFHDSERYRQMLISHWEGNVLGQHINPFFRQHFFQRIFPTINALDELKDLAKIHFPTHIFYGKEDYITPISPKTKKTLKLMQNINLIEYKKCGHYIYIENSEQFYSDFQKYLTSVQY